MKHEDHQQAKFQWFQVTIVSLVFLAIMGTIIWGIIWLIGRIFGAW